MTFDGTGQSSYGYHRLETFIICPRRFAYRYLLHLVPVVTPKPLALGTCVHEALAAIYRCESAEDGLARVPTKTAYMVPTARKIVQAYETEYAHERLNVRFVEKEFHATIRGIPFTRRVDLGIEREGELWIVDHKTAGRLSARLATTSYDPTLFTQLVVVSAQCKKESGLSFGGMLINLIGTHEPFEFQRAALHFSRELLGGVVESLHYWSKQCDDAVNSDCSPWSYPQSWQCQGRYSKCDYLPLCLYGRDEAANYDREG